MAQYPNHTVELNARETAALREWLKSPSGAHGDNPRVTFEAVEGGGILVRTVPYRAPVTAVPQGRNPFRKRS